MDRRETVDADPPIAFERRLGLLIHKLGVDVLERATPGFAALGIDGRTYITLAVLADDHPASQLDLARIIGRVPGLIVSVVDQLEADGLVKRHRSAADRRRTAVELTARGRRMLERADAVAKSVEDELFETVSEEERSALHSLLQRVLRETWQPC
jgi:DNA-binding MarR family transcriptional regulator